MAVSLPTSADVRKVRTQATKTVNTQLDTVKTPLLAWVGAGDLAVAKVTDAVETARTKAEARRVEAAKRREKFAAQVKDLPTELKENFNADELRKRYDDATAEAKARYEDVVEQVRKVYTDLADRGEVAVEKIRSTPRVRKVLDGVSEANTEFEKRLDKAVDELHDASEEVLGKVSTQTRSYGEKAARATQKLTAEAAEAVSEASQDFADELTEAGADAASATRGVSRKAANKTAPKKAEPKQVARPVTKRTSAKD